MTLSEWMYREGVTQAQMASRLGVSQMVVSKWLRGEATPQIRNALLITKETKGAVPVEAWAQPQPAYRPQKTGPRAAKAG
jgi:transcriptional regulator with XRE-family HTH domain